MDRKYKKSTIKPFWEMIPRFFLYGLKPRSLIVAALIAIINYIVGGGLLNLILLAITIKYSMAALQETAEGNLEPPEFSYDTIVGRYELPIKLYATIFLYTLLIGAATKAIGIAAFIFLVIAGVVLLPAMTITLAYTESFLQAINPINSLTMARRIGTPYLAMLFFLFLFSSVSEFFQYFFINTVTEAAIEPLLMAINATFTIITFHMMGYTLLQYHERLGLETPERVAGTMADEKKYDSPLLQSFIDSGKVDAAVAEMEYMISRAPEDLEMWRRLYIYLVTQGLRDKLALFAPRYIGELLDNHRGHQAAQLYLDGLERGQDYKPTQLHDYLPLVCALRQARASKHAVALANGIHKQFPGDQLIPALYLEIATILCEELHRDDMAVKILQFLMKNFSGHTIMPEVLNYLRVVQRLQQSS